MTHINQWDGCWVGTLFIGNKLVYKSKPVTTWGEARRRCARNMKRTEATRYEIVDSAYANQECRCK